MNANEGMIRHAEVMAVLRAMRSGRAPRIGESLEYFIDFSAAARSDFAGPRNKSQKPYRFEVEQWHLDAAREELSG